ncbi:MAG: hypothetical protein F6K39_31600 [Okeania sp. SIO3B3]|nr:hypothetical protein [Okeania sp. SIO3B3]
MTKESVLRSQEVRKKKKEKVFRLRKRNGVLSHSDPDMIFFIKSGLSRKKCCCKIVGLGDPMARSSIMDNG